LPHSIYSLQALETGAADRAAPAVLLSYQQKWCAGEADVAVWEKSRRVGASWTDAADSVLEASAEDGQDALYIGYSEDMAREYVDDCAMWAAAFNRAAEALKEVMFDDTDAAGNIREIKAFRIDFASGHKVLALSSRPRSIRGKQGKVTIDEAAFHDDLAGLIKAAMAMLIWGGRVRIISSHNGEDNPFNLLVKDIRAGKLPYTIHRTTFDDALGAGLFERRLLTAGPKFKYRTREAWRASIYEQYGENAAEELDCIPRAGSGVYIPRTIVERCQRDGIPVLRYARPMEWMLNARRLDEAKIWIADVLKPAINALPSDRRTCLGLDIGRSGDLWYLTAAQAQGGGRWREAFNLELRRIPFDVQRLVLFFALDNVPLFFHIKIDARGNGQQIAEEALQKYGPARVECVMASTSWYAAHFPPYKAALEDQSYELARGEDVVADHRRVILKNGYPAMDDGRDKGSDGGYRHGDGVVARVMMWAATKNESAPIEYTAAPRRHEQRDRDEDAPPHARVLTAGAW